MANWFADCRGLGRLWSGVFWHHHQTKNASAIAEQEGAVLIKEKDLDVDFENLFSQIVNSPEKQNKLSENIKKLALENATQDIADEVEKLLNKWI